MLGPRRKRAGPRAARLPRPGEMAAAAPEEIPSTEVAIRPRVSKRKQKSLADKFEAQVSGKAYTIPASRVSTASIPVVTVSGINLSNLSTEAKKKMSVINVTSPSLDPNDDNGVNSRWMGVTEDVQCNKCERGLMSCQGHYGLIEFPADAKIYHPLQMQYVILVLRSVCRGCAEMLLSDEELDAIGVEGLDLHSRLKLISKHSESVGRCQTVICGKTPESCIECSPNPEYLLKPSVDKQKVFWRLKGEKGKENEKSMKINDVFKILSCISRETADKLGYQNPAHPKDMILESILVPPVCVRFPMKQGATRGSNRLNEKYATIVKRVNDLGARGASVTEDKILALATAVKDIMTSPENQTGKMSNAQAVSYKNMLNGKGGAIRGNVTAKRVALSARTVVTPEANADSDEAGVPDILARHLTVDETVNSLNREAMVKLLAEDKITHINNRVLHRTERVIKIGDSVSRRLQNGDYVMLNRQPSLHKESMMSFRVKLVPGYTFRLHLSATSPYNADFDGDEMNLHLPQTLEAMSELREIASIKSCMMNAQSNRPNVGLVYDATVAAFLLTDASTLVKETLFMDSLTMMQNPPVLSELQAKVEAQGQLFRTSVRSQLVIEGDTEIIASETFRVDVNPAAGYPEPKIDITSLSELVDLSDFPKLAGTRVYVDTQVMYNREPLKVRTVNFVDTDGKLTVEPKTGGKFLLYSDGPSGGELSVLAGKFKIKTSRTGVRSVYFQATPYQVDATPDLSADVSAVSRAYINQADYSLALRNPSYELMYTFSDDHQLVHHPGHDDLEHLVPGKLSSIQTLPESLNTRQFEPDNIVAGSTIRVLPGERLTGHKAYLEAGSLPIAQADGKLVISRVVRLGNSFQINDTGNEFIVYAPGRRAEAFTEAVETITGALSAKGSGGYVTNLNFQTHGAAKHVKVPLSPKGKERETRRKTSASLLSNESRRIPIKSAPIESIGRPARLDMVSFDRNFKPPDEPKPRTKHAPDDVLERYIKGQPLVPSEEPLTEKEPELPKDLVVTVGQFIPENKEREAPIEYLVSTEDQVESGFTETRHIMGRIVKMGGKLFFVNDVRSDLGPDPDHEFGYSGRALFAALLPANFKYESQNQHNLEDVIIRNGVIIQGQLTKKQVGPVAGSIIQYLWKDYGQEVASQFLSDAYVLLTRWFTENMFSTGIEDCLPGPDLFGFTDVEDEAIKREMEATVPNFKKIKALLSRKQELMTKTKLKLEAIGSPPTDPKDLKKWTADVSAVMNITNEAGLGISRDVLDKSNPFNIMYQSGGKGSAANISQMIAFASQQFFQGEVMPMNLGGTRCLPYFEPGSTDPRARGFCSDSFTSGLDLPGWVFSMMAGRPQILETVLRTADAGTLQRYMTTAMADVKMAQDGTVRNSNDRIISFAYGGDNMDGSHLLKLNTSLGMYRTFVDVKPEIERLNDKYSS